MGIVKKTRKSYVSHVKRWDAKTIEFEKELDKEYCIKNKKEVRKVEFLLKKIKTQAKNFIRSRATPEEMQPFITRLHEKGFLESNTSGIDDVLSITVRQILDRKLSYLVLKKKMARTAKQARQLVIHGHIALDGRRVNLPNMLITRSEEELISFFDRSKIASNDHPLRTDIFKEIREEEAAIAASPPVTKEAPQDENDEDEEAEEKPEEK